MKVDDKALRSYIEYVNAFFPHSAYTQNQVSSLPIDFLCRSGTKKTTSHAKGDAAKRGLLLRRRGLWDDGKSGEGREMNLGNFGKELLCIVGRGGGISLGIYTLWLSLKKWFRSFLVDVWESGFLQGGYFAENFARS